MSRYSRLKDELARMQQAAAELIPEEPLAVIYDASYLRSLPEQEQQSYLQGLIEAKELELAAKSVGLRGRRTEAAGAIVFFPQKGSYQTKEEQDHE